MTGYSADTNIMLRSAQPAHSMYAVTSAALNKLVSDKQSLYILPQNVREFWNVATRSIDRNGLGFTHAQVKAEVQRIETIFTVLEDGLPVYREWLSLIDKHKVSGVQVHDAYIAAAMNVHGITNLLTFNVTDFIRYGINVVSPANL